MTPNEEKEALHACEGTAKRTPWWVWVLIAVLVSIEPVSHVWVQYSPPEGAVPTGLRTGDSYVYLHCMRMFETGFFSPYASCKSPWGPRSYRFYSLPAHWIYGVLGGVANLAGLDHFLALGLFNGLAGAFYLYAVYRFLRRAAPNQGNLAFLLFIVGGGPGGVLYWVTGALGLHDAPSFDAVFMRYAQYELVEGSHLWPVLHLPRLYYTSALGCCLLALSALMRAVDSGRNRDLAFACALMLAGQTLNMRVGTFVWAVAALYLVTRSDTALGKRIWWAGMFALPVLAGGGFTFLLLRQAPAFSRDYSVVARESIWLSAFVSASLPHWILVPREIKRMTPLLPYLARAAAITLVGYLAAFALLYGGYQLYYGNLWRIADTAVAIRVSDWALIGAAVGLLAGLLWRSAPGGGGGQPAAGAREIDVARSQNGWVVLWLLIFVAGGISAWGGGWYMRLVPRRLLMLIGLPLCILSAQSLQRLRTTRPRLARGFTAAIVFCGICSIVVASLYFQGPCGRTPGKGPFAYLHYEIMAEADAAMLERLGPGRVLAPCFNPFSFTEVIALRPENTVAFGVGTVLFSDLRFEPMRKQVDAFFSPEATDAFRRAFVREWRVDYVYCPDTCPVPPEVARQLRETPWLRVVAGEGSAAVFAVEGG